MTIKKFKDYSDREKRIHRVEKGQADRVVKHKKDIYNMASEYFSSDAFDEDFHNDTEDTTQTQ